MGSSAKQQSSITVYHLPTKENFRFPFPLAANKRKFAISVLYLQKTNGSCHFQFAETWKDGHIDMEILKKGDNKRKTEAHAIFLNTFTVCSSCKWKFVICSFVDEETNGSYPFANGLIGLAHL
jgi:hypothetical protein